MTSIYQTVEKLLQCNLDLKQWNLNSQFKLEVKVKKMYKKD